VCIITFIPKFALARLSLQMRFFHQFN